MNCFFPSRFEVALIRNHNHFSHRLHMQIVSSSSPAASFLISLIFIIFVLLKWMIHAWKGPIGNGELNYIDTVKIFLTTKKNNTMKNDYYVTDRSTVTVIVIALELNVDMVCEKMSSKPDDEKMVYITTWLDYGKKKGNAMTCEKMTPKNKDPKQNYFCYWMNEWSTQNI